MHLEAQEINSISLRFMKISLMELWPLTISRKSRAVSAMEVLVDNNVYIEKRIAL